MPDYDLKELSTANNKISKSVMINSAVDLNDYKTEGFYRCESNAIAAACTNCPTVKAFSLVVIRSHSVRQYLMRYDGRDTYFRNYNLDSNKWDAEWTQTDGYHNVQSNIDFNDYTTPGDYFIWYGNQSGNTNKPTTYGGLLRVFELPNGIGQLFFTYGATRSIFYRSYYSTNVIGWSNWIVFYSSENISSILNGNQISGNNGTKNDTLNNFLEELYEIKAETIHDHGNITNGGAIGSNPNLFVVTGNNGKIVTASKIGNLDFNGAIGSDSNKAVVTGSNGKLTTTEDSLVELTATFSDDSTSTYRLLPGS